MNRRRYLHANGVGVREDIREMTTIDFCAEVSNANRHVTLCCLDVAGIRTDSANKLIRQRRGPDHLTKRYASDEVHVKEWRWESNVI
jgi:hypothetical protein